MKNPAKFLTIVLICIFVMQGTAQNATSTENESRGIELATQAEEIRQSGKVDEALELYNKAIELNPKFGLAYFGRSLCYQAKKDHEKEAADLDKALELRPGFITFLFNRMKANLALERFAAVVRDTTEMIAQSDQPEIRFYRSIGFYELEKYNEAIEDLDFVIAKSKGVANAYLIRAASRSALKQWELALTDIEKAIELDPQEAEFLRSRARVLKMLKRHSEAESQLSAILENEPNDHSVLLARADVLMLMGRYESAKRDYNKAIYLQPDLVDGYIGLGALYFQLEKYDDLISASTNAIRADPKEPFAHNNRAFGYILIGKPGLAGPDIEMALSLDPKHQFARNNKALLLIGEKKYSEAHKIIDELLKEDEQFAYAFLNRGLALNGQRKYREAIQTLSVAIKIDPKLRRAYIARAEAFKALKKKREYEVDLSTSAKLLDDIKKVKLD